MSSVIKEMFFTVFPFLPHNVDQDSIEADRRQKTAMQWMPVVDIENGIIYTKNNMLVGMIRVYPVNISLLSNKEKKRKVELLASQLNSIQDNFEIFCIGRPVDLSSYLEWLNNFNKSETDIMRKRLLRNMTIDATKKSTSGDIQERRFYISIYRKKSNTNSKAENEFISYVKEMQDKIAGAELKTEFCDDNALINVCSMFANPTYAGIEIVDVSDLYDIPPYIVELGGGGA